MNIPNLAVAADRKKVLVREEKLEMDIKPIYKGKKYFLRTYGCQMNVHDSEEIKYYLESLGYEAVDELELADIVVLNTCAIRENAKDKVFGYLGRCKHLKKEKPDLIIAVAGCLMQKPNEIEEIHNRHKYIDIIIGTHNLNELPSLIEEANNLKIIVDKLNSIFTFFSSNITLDFLTTSFSTSTILNFLSLNCLFPYSNFINSSNCFTNLSILFVSSKITSA